MHSQSSATERTQRRAISTAAKAALVVTSGLVAALALVGPASAAADRFSFSDPETTETFACGAVWTYSGEHTVTIVTTPKQESFLRWVQQDYYPGTITYQGTTYTANDRQVHIRYVDKDGVPIGVLNGQGLFTHLPGIGVAAYDVGHLVFNDETGQTLLRSNKVVGFDDSFDFGAEVCAALTGR
jgi:hypothetical protein